MRLSHRFQQLVITRFVFTALAVLHQAQGAPSPESPPGNAEAPAAYLQILNGISPSKVSVSLNGQLLYPDIAAGARISSFGIAERRTTLLVSKSGSAEQKEIVLQFPKHGYYTLVLTGDFAPLPAANSPVGKTMPDYRIFAALFPNKKPKGQTVDVRLVNGTPGKTIKLLRRGSVQAEAGPWQAAAAVSQPSELYLQAAVGEVRRNLYLAQEPPAQNITVVFYDTGEQLGFRAMTETWAETSVSP